MGRKLIIELDCDNAAFEEPNFIGGVSECLDHVLISLAQGSDNGRVSCENRIRDVNGNTCGTFTFTVED